MSDKANILVVDDEPNIQLVIKNVLQKNYAVTTVGSGEEALDILSEQRFDLVLLDIYLPQLSGLEVLLQLKNKYPHLIIIMLTGSATIESAIYALRNGAANYLKKPTSTEEILNSVQEGLAQANQLQQQKAKLQQARQKFLEGLALLNEVLPEQADLRSENEGQTKGAEENRFIQCGPLTIDTYRRMATLNSDLLDLTSGEYDLLVALASEAPQVLTPQHLVRTTRGYEANLVEARELIRWQIYLLRQKIELDPSTPKYILNVRGKGYMWAAI